jgi:hypothetical protein
MNTMTNDFTYRQISDAVATLDMATISTTAVAESESDRIEQLITIYVGIRPLLASLSNLRLIPVTWRNALNVFIQSLDAVAILRGFKAGRTSRFSHRDGARNGPVPLPAVLHSIGRACYY